MEITQQHTIWQFIQTRLSRATPVTLLYVVESEGSSPGRKGFIMAASLEACTGTIGGGIMEYKLVELSRSLMRQGDMSMRLITQYHDKERSDQSGMICSGMQRIVIIPLHRAYYTHVENCIHVFEDKKQGQIEITPVDIKFNHSSRQADGFLFENETSWQYRETIGVQPKLHIIGAGHVALALSELMSRLGFYIIVYDDRQGLNTLLDNLFADEKQIVSYDSIGEVISGDAKDYLVIMTIGYRNDKIVLKQLMDKPFLYTGILGSEAKIRSLFLELRSEGFSEAQLSRIHAPIGLTIHSQTAYEIAVSIAAEIIQEKNLK